MNEYRYFRTKDGIWLFGGTHHKGDVIIGKKQEIDFGYCFDKKDIIKQADTIEELCDWLVLKLDGEIRVLYKNWDIALQCEGNDIWIYKEIYGAIDTEKGLIYVARINEERELELL